MEFASSSDDEGRSAVLHDDGTNGETNGSAETKGFANNDEYDSDGGEHAEEQRQAPGKRSSIGGEEGGQRGDDDSEASDASSCTSSDGDLQMLVVQEPSTPSRPSMAGLSLLDLSVTTQTPDQTPRGAKEIDPIEEARRIHQHLLNKKAGKASGSVIPQDPEGPAEDGGDGTSEYESSGYESSDVEEDRGNNGMFTSPVPKARMPPLFAGTKVGLPGELGLGLKLNLGAATPNPDQTPRGAMEIDPIEEARRIHEELLKTKSNGTHVMAVRENSISFNDGEKAQGAVDDELDHVVSEPDDEALMELLERVNKRLESIAPITGKNEAALQQFYSNDGAESAIEVDEDVEDKDEYTDLSVGPTASVLERLEVVGDSAVKAYDVLQSIQRHLSRLEDLGEGAGCPDGLDAPSLHTVAVRMAACSRLHQNDNDVVQEGLRALASVIRCQQRFFGKVPLKMDVLGAYTYTGGVAAKYMCSKETSEEVQGMALMLVSDLSTSSDFCNGLMDGGNEGIEQVVLGILNLLPKPEFQNNCLVVLHNLSLNVEAAKVIVQCTTHALEASPSTRLRALWSLAANPSNVNIMLKQSPGGVMAWLKVDDDRDAYSSEARLGLLSALVSTDEGLASLEAHVPVLQEWCCSMMKGAPDSLAVQTQGCVALCVLWDTEVGVLSGGEELIRALKLFHPDPTVLAWGLKGVRLVVANISNELRLEEPAPATLPIHRLSRSSRHLHFEQEDDSSKLVTAAWKVLSGILRSARPEEGTIAMILAAALQISLTDAGRKCMVEDQTLMWLQSALRSWPGHSEVYVNSIELMGGLLETNSTMEMFVFAGGLWNLMGALCDKETTVRSQLVIMSMFLKILRSCSVAVALLLRQKALHTLIDLLLRVKEVAVKCKCLQVIGEMFDQSDTGLGGHGVPSVTKTDMAVEMLSCDGVACLMLTMLETDDEAQAHVDYWGVILMVKLTKCEGLRDAILKNGEWGCSSWLLKTLRRSIGIDAEMCGFCLDGLADLLAVADVEIKTNDILHPMHCMPIAAVQAAACKAIAALCESPRVDGRQTSAFWKCMDFARAKVFDALGRFPHMEEVQEMGLRALSALIYLDGEGFEGVVYDMIKTVIASMGSHGANKGICADGLKIIHHITEAYARDLPVFDERGDQAIMTVMSTHWGDPAITATWCNCIAVIARRYDVVSDGPFSSSPELVRKCLRAHGDDQDVQKAACKALAGLCRNPIICDSMAAEGFCDVQGAVEQFDPEDVNSYTAGLALLGLMGLQEAPTKRLAGLILAGLKKSGEDLDNQFQVMLALYRAGSTSKEVAQHLMDEGGMADAVAMMQKYHEHDDVQGVCARALLVFFRQAKDAERVPAGAVAAITTAMETFRRNEEIQIVGSRALCVLCTLMEPDPAKSFTVLQASIKYVLQGMRELPDPGLLENGVRVLDFALKRDANSARCIMREGGIPVLQDMVHDEGVPASAAIARSCLQAMQRDVEVKKVVIEFDKEYV